MANAVRKVTGTNDSNIVVNSGVEAVPDEPHHHVHIIPRRAGDGFDIPLPFNGSQMPDRTVLDAYAAQIIAALRDPMRADADSLRWSRSVLPDSRSERTIDPGAGVCRVGRGGYGSRSAGSRSDG